MVKNIPCKHTWKNNITFAKCIHCGERRGWQEFIDENKALIEALFQISKYDDPYTPEGICPYGCDTPNIALEALKELEDEQTRPN